MFFRGKYEFLSNFYPCHVTMVMGDGKEHTFQCSEAAFQAFKTNDTDTIIRFEECSGRQAKSLGRRIPMAYTREGWEHVKEQRMDDVLHAKFSQNPELVPLLTSIDGEIAEDNTWRDTEWGRYNGKGRNKLGVLLMSLRDEYRSKEQV